MKTQDSLLLGCLQRCSVAVKSTLKSIEWPDLTSTHIPLLLFLVGIHVHVSNPDPGGVG
jgi:hypothetical protein